MMNNAPISDLRCEYRAEPVPPEANRLVANVDASLKQQILDLTERQRSGCRTVLWATARQLRKPSFRWIPGRSCTNIQTGPLNGSDQFLAADDDGV